IGLWPSARGRGRATRGFVLAGVPPTVAFAGIATAAAAAFDSSRSADGLDQIAWTGIASLLPVALAVAVALGAMTARRAPSEDFEASAVIATWFIFAASLVSGLWLGAFIPAGDAAVGTPTRSLYLAALVAAGLAAWRTPHSGAHTTYGGADVLLSEATYRRPIRAGALAIAGVAGAAALAGAIYLTLRGLQQGFLS
ncbi:MAG TPA: hypothetical protein VG408_07455, partial [Actinomycetota bacterium]|nr:hypothetical protein [Actinomycetota bacterium]